MSKLQLLKEPGFVYDLISLFTLRFNKQAILTDLKNEMQNEEIIEHYENWYEKVSDVSDDLFLFFYSPDKTACLVTTYYFRPYADTFIGGYSFSTFLKALSNRDQLIRDMIRYYLVDVTDEEIEECVSSLVKLFDRIKATSHTDEVKKKLYEFFIDPEPYIHSLLFELTEKKHLVEDHYKDTYEDIIAVYNRTTYEGLARCLEEAESTNLEKLHTSVRVSYCMLNKVLFAKFSSEDGVLFLLGLDYDKTFQPMEEPIKMADLESLGSAFCEESRAKIMELLLERGALTCKDLEKAFEFSGSTAYHHVTILVRTGAVKTHNVGKTIYYSINNDYFDSIIRTLRKYSNEKRRTR
ncbi:MAG: helix-turn-helix transcriptional regulator [Clostridia bacterium]|nr:helix-turn-helix transcriptional regulator [Clostridia bacterium]